MSRDEEADSTGSRCPNVTRCELFPLFRLEASLETWKIRYCDSDYHRCKRYLALKSGKRPPANLLPSGKLLPVGKPLHDDA